jgi:hypothetical protein
MRGRLTLGHVVAVVAAFALMLVTAMDWYTTKLGEERREAERNAEALQRVEPDLDEEASRLAEEEERNAWQEDGALDRVLLIVLLATVGAAVLAALAYAAGRRFKPPLAPTVALAGLALLGELLVTYRIVQEPEDDNITEVVAGPPLALLCLGAISFGAFWAMREEGRAPGEGKAGWRAERAQEERSSAAEVGDAHAETP